MVVMCVFVKVGVVVFVFVLGGWILELRLGEIEILLDIIIIIRLKGLIRWFGGIGGERWDLWFEFW